MEGAGKMPDLQSGMRASRPLCVGMGRVLSCVGQDARPPKWSAGVSPASRWKWACVELRRARCPTSEAECARIARIRCFMIDPRRDVDTF